MKVRLFLTAATTSFLLSACGGGSNKTPPPPPPPPTYSIGGSVTNLVGTNGGLQLQDSGGNTLDVGANGSFKFSALVTSGDTYDVTVSQQPTSPAQQCEVTNGTGTATANVTSVAVDCGHNEWTWMGGSNMLDQPGIYGTLGTPAPGNIPGGRGGSNFWVDKSQNVSLFGGRGPLINSNDLWEYSNSEWAWMGGPQVNGETNSELEGSYGTMGTPSNNNNPGATVHGVTWTDSSGNFWLFSGAGYDSIGTYGYLNALWEYSNGEWTWMGGSNVADQKGTYPTMPGGRWGAAWWVDSSGIVWVLGGTGYDSAGTLGELNDLWKYSSGQWTWVGGSETANQKGTYGNLGVSAGGNMPGGRDHAVRWADSSGNFWLFGGWGFDSAGTNGELNDLWEYSNGEWTWMGGSDLANQPASYGFEGAPSATNNPGGRDGAIVWTDASGNAWLFGGETEGQTVLQNDLWKYSNGLWTWMGGSQLFDQPGSYGTLGTANPGNVPGARANAVHWIDAQGNLWIFGGGHTEGNGGKLNDLWVYRP